MEAGQGEQQLPADLHHREHEQGGGGKQVRTNFMKKKVLLTLGLCCTQRWQSLECTICTLICLQLIHEGGRVHFKS